MKLTLVGARAVTLGTILQLQLWARRRHAWPLLVLTIPMYYAQLWLLPLLGSEPLGDGSRAQPFCLLLSRPFAVWAVAAIWLVVDVFLVVWIDRALNRRGEPSRPAALFFTWQVTKIAFLFLFLSVLSALGPAEPVVRITFSD